MRLSKFISLAGVLMMLACACESENNDGKSQCIGEPKISACPDVLAPVCGCDGETYDNDCYAKAAGVLQWTEGACQ